MSPSAIVVMELDKHINLRQEREMDRMEGTAQERTIQSIASGTTEDVSDYQMP